MKHVLLILAFALAVAAPLRAADAGDFPFHVGEKLTYQIYWGPFVGGHATLEVVDIVKIDDQDCYHLVAKAWTTGLADLLFHIESTTESWLDVSTLYSRQYREDRLEGKHRHANESHYDYANSQVTTTNFVTGKVKSVPLVGHVQDLISSFYYVRTQPLALHAEQKFALNMTGTQYDVTVRPDDRKVMFFRPLGDVPALRIEPTPTLSFVAANNGRMWFWISDNKHKLPLLVTSDMKIGSAKLVLTEVKYGDPAADKPSAKIASNAPPAAVNPTDP